MKKIAFLLLILGFSYAGVQAGPSARGSRNLRTLVEWMSGKFSSKDHAKRDTAYAHLEMHLLPIWENYVTDGMWLYQEFVDARQADGKVTMQRFLKITDLDDKQIEIQFYTIQNIADYAGEYKKEKPFSALRPDDLSLVEECAVVITRKTEMKFQGMTTGKDCKTGSRKATYIVNDFQVFENKMIWMEVGYDSDDKLIWGPKNGGYQFRKEQDKK